MRWGAAVCLVALGCGAAAEVRPEAPGDRDALRAMRGDSWDPNLGCDEEGCPDWMPEPLAGWSIYGYVLDRGTGQPVVDARVVASEAATGRRVRATTNALGQFHFGPLAAGRYDVAIITDGGRDRWPDVVLDAGRRTALRVHVNSAEK